MARRIRKQPSGPTRVDWSNPISRELASASFSDAFPGLYDYVGERFFVDSHPADQSHTNLIRSEAGNGRRSRAGSYSYQITPQIGNLIGLPPNVRRGQCTMLTILRPLTTNASVRTFAYAGEGAGSWFMCRHSLSNGFLQAQAVNGTALPSDSAYVSGQLYVMVSTNNAGSSSAEKQKLFVNGVKQTTTGNYSGNSAKRVDAININCGGVANLFDAYATFVWHRELSDAEIKSISEDPYQLFVAPGRRKRRYDVLGAGGTTHTLVGTNANQINTSTSGVIVQHHGLVAASATNAKTSSTGAVSTRHTLAGANSTSTPSVTTGAVTQHHALQGANANSATASTTGAAGQRHTLVGANSSQANTSTTATLGQIRHTLVGADSTTAHQSSAAAVSQHHLLAGAMSNNTHQSTAAAVTQRATLAAASCGQANQSSTGAVSLRHALVAQSVVQYNTSLAAAVSCRHMLVASSCLQTNQSSSVRLEGARYNVDLTRVWVAPGESRVHVSFKEYRLYAAPGENRVHAAAAEDRIVRQ